MIDGWYYVTIGEPFRNTETRPAKYGQWFQRGKISHMYEYSQWEVAVEWQKGYLRGVDLFRRDYAYCGLGLHNKKMHGMGKEAMAKKGVCKDCQRIYLDWMKIEGAIGEEGRVDLGGSLEGLERYWQEKRAEKAQEPKETPWYDL